MTCGRTCPRSYSTCVWHMCRHSQESNRTGETLGTIMILHGNVCTEAIIPQSYKSFTEINRHNHRPYCSLHFMEPIGTAPSATLLLLQLYSFTSGSSPSAPCALVHALCRSCHKGVPAFVMDHYILFGIPSLSINRSMDFSQCSKRSL